MELSSSPLSIASPSLHRFVMPIASSLVMRNHRRPISKPLCIALVAFQYAGRSYGMPINAPSPKDVGEVGVSIVHSPIRRRWWQLVTTVAIIPPTPTSTARTTPIISIISLFERLRVGRGGIFVDRYRWVDTRRGKTGTIGLWVV